CVRELATRGRLPAALVRVANRVATVSRSRTAVEEPDRLYHLRRRALDGIGGCASMGGSGRADRRDGVRYHDHAVDAALRRSLCGRAGWGKAEAPDVHR